MFKSEYDLLRKPLITEKGTLLNEQNKYIFEVASTATKKDVKAVVEKLFEVKVSAVNIINIHGKTKRFKGIKGRRADVKKAVVTLNKDYTIDLAGGVK